MNLDMEYLRVDNRRGQQIVENIGNVIKRIQTVNKDGRKVRLVAVSKLQPASDVLALHTLDPPHYHFGENYFQELAEKAAALPRTIKWHFIGTLQTNKCRPLAEQIPNLWCVASVDSVKKADALEKGRATLVNRLRREGQGSGFSQDSQGENQSDINRADNLLLRIKVQVNTSGEASKSGIDPLDATQLCHHIQSNCPHLRLQGLMTIGAIARSINTTSETENEDFLCLRETRDKVAVELGIDSRQLELSMGMSSDFEGAIAMGSDEVRIGSTIFGDRPPKRVTNELETA